MEKCGACDGMGKRFRWTGGPTETCPVCKGSGLDPGKKTLEERFWDFHDANPDIYAELVRLARRAQEAGREKVGIAMLYEVVRWNRFLNATENPGERYKLNNDFRSRYARLIMEQEKDLREMFDVRELKACEEAIGRARVTVTI